jgi:hypothetical protein
VGSRNDFPEQELATFEQIEEVVNINTKKQKPMALAV